MSERSSLGTQQLRSPLTKSKKTNVVSRSSSLFALPSSQIIHPLNVDVSGQITEAFSKEEYFQKWGRHYLPSITRAHLLQVCTNFKDPGLQVRYKRSEAMRWEYDIYASNDRSKLY